MSQQPTIRPIEPEMFGDFSRVLQRAFGDSPNEEISEHDRKFLEFERTLAAFDGSDLVATAGIYSFEMTVPGRTVPTAGVTWVSVLPTHRRRGLLTRLMRRQLDDIHEAGQEPVAALWASEPPIYGRFGYGCASYTYRATVPRRANRLWPVAGSEHIRLRDVDGSEHLDATLRVYDHDRARRPGMLALQGVWRTRGLFFPEAYRHGATPLRTVLAERADGEVRGYTRYASRHGQDFNQATTVVRELHALDGPAMAALLMFLLDHDLSAETSLWLRPADDPVLQLLVDPRSAAVTRNDGLNVRLVDVAAALAARTYAVPVDVVLDVEDDFCPWNAGRWRLSGDATGATCEATTDAADIGLGVRELASAYLGGPTLLGLADAGLVDEHTAGAVAELSLALRHQPAPWNSFIF
jgi:predicted acetyltransferase